MEFLLGQVAILTTISCKVFFSKIKQCVTDLLWSISNADLYFSKTLSKSCFCYLSQVPHNNSVPSHFVHFFKVITGTDSCKHRQTVKNIQCEKKLFKSHLHSSKIGKTVEKHVISTNQKMAASTRV